MSIGFLGHLGLTQESEFGEVASPPAVFAQIENESISMDNNLIRPAAINGRRYNSWSVPGKISAGGGIGAFMLPEGAVPWFLKGLWGQVSSAQAAAGVYDHTFSPAHTASLPSFSLQVDNGDACQTWTGCTVGGASIFIARNGSLGLDLDITAQRPVESQSATPSFAVVEPWNARNVEFTLNGAANLDFVKFSLKITNKVEPLWTLNGKRYCRRHVTRGFEIEGSIKLQFSSEEQRRRLWGSVSATEPQGVILPGSLTVTAVHDTEIAPGYNYSLTLELPRIYYMAAPATISGMSEVITQTIAFIAACDSAQDKFAEMKLRNSVSEYPGPD